MIYNGAKALSFAVNPATVAKLLGQIMLILAALTAVPLGASVVFGEIQFSWRYLLVIAVLVGIALPTLRLPTPERIQSSEALVVVALTFIATPLLMSFPMLASGLAPIDVLFEAVSAVTTTGLSTVTDVESRSRTFVFARAWMQWYGGLGIAVLSIALLIGHGIVARQLATETIGANELTTARAHARHVLAVYLLLSLLGFVLLWATLGDGFAALTHLLAAVSTGGFSSFDASIGAIESWPARMSIALLSALGAVPLALYYRAYTGGWRSGLGDPELKALLAACLIVTAMLALLKLNSTGQLGVNEVLEAAFTAVSAQTTTGFSITSPAELTDTAKIILAGSMLIGGGLGSTAGGIKLLRLLIIFQLLRWIVQRSTMPAHAVLEPRLAGKVLESDDLVRALVLVILFVLVVAISWLCFVAYGYPPVDALFDVVSATATVGLSTGIVSTQLPAVLKALLCLDMLLGRLEIIALLVIMYPRTWIGKRKSI